MMWLLKTSLGNLFHCLVILFVKQVFPKTSLNLSWFPIGSSLSIMLWRAWHWLFCNLPKGAGRVLLGAPGAAPSAGWASPGCSASSHRVSAQVPSVLVTLCWNPSTLLSFLYSGCRVEGRRKGHNTLNVKWFNDCSVEMDNHFPGSTAYDLVNTTEDTFALLCCQCTLLAHTQPTVPQDSQVLSCRDISQGVSPQAAQGSSFTGEELCILF